MILFILLHNIIILTVFHASVVINSSPTINLFIIHLFIFQKYPPLTCLIPTFLISSQTTTSSRILTHSSVWWRGLLLWASSPSFYIIPLFCIYLFINLCLYCLSDILLISFIHIVHSFPHTLSLSPTLSYSFLYSISHLFIHSFTLSLSFFLSSPFLSFSFSPFLLSVCLVLASIPRQLLDQRNFLTHSK